MNRSLCLLLLLAFGIVAAQGAPFRNLGFDEANTNNPVAIIDLGWFWGTPEDLLPGWEIAQKVVGVNAKPAGLDFISLYEPGVIADLPVEGRFSVGLLPPPGTSYTLSQSGDVPDGARAIHFLSSGVHVRLSINGEEVPTVYVPRSIGYPGDAVSEVYDVFADISGFSGQTVGLSLATLPKDVAPLFSGLDSISFIVPEPSSVVLLGAGVAGLVLFMRRKRIAF